MSFRLPFVLGKRMFRFMEAQVCSGAGFLEGEQVPGQKPVEVLFQLSRGMSQWSGKTFEKPIEAVH